MCAFSQVCVILCFCNLCMLVCARVITLHYGIKAMGAMTFRISEHAGKTIWSPFLRSLFIWKMIIVLDCYTLWRKSNGTLKVIQKKIERIFNNDRIDIEFCIKNEKIYIFQCRPLKQLKNVNDELIDDGMDKNDENFDDHAPTFTRYRPSEALNCPTRRQEHH